MNTTNKAKTMVVVEGAKHNISVNSQDIKNIEMVQLAINEICEKKSEHIVLDNNSNNDQQCFPTSEMSKCTLQRNNVEKNLTQVQTNEDITVANEKTLSELHVNNKLVHNNKFLCSKLLDETLLNTISDNKDRNSYIKHDLLSVKLSQMKQNYFARENSILEESATKMGHRKKLYTGRDSPTDLIKIKCSNKSIVLKSQQNLHPALDFRCKLKRHKIFKMRKRNHFHMFKRNVTNNSKLNSSCYNKLLQSASSQTTSIKIDNIKSNYTLSVNHNESINAENLTKELTNLTGLLEDDIQEHKKLNGVITNPCNLNDDNDKVRKQNSMVKNLTNFNPTISLPRLPVFNIQKSEKQDEIVIKLKNLNPVVRLKQLSEVEIQKYKKSTNMLTNIGNLNPIVRLKKLSNFDIQEYRNANNEKTLNKNDLLSTKYYLQNNEGNKKITRSQLKLDTNKSNSTCRKECRTRNKKFKRIYSIKSISTSNLRNLNLRKNVYKRINDISEIT